MGKKTTIDWTDSTWNPWIGCSKVSPGCDYCYAERDMTRYGRDFASVTRTADASFYAPLKWEEPRRVFTCSWSDFFHKKADPFREEAWKIIASTPHLTYQVLTKRPGLMVDWANKHGWLDNIWAGTSVESQKYVPRLIVLGRVPAKVRFVSLEPLLSPVDLRPWLGLPVGKHPSLLPPILQWVIVGGESGPGCRPLKEEWVNHILYQCIRARVPFFFKQWGGWLDKRAGIGAILDGQLWKEIPRS